MSMYDKIMEERKKVVLANDHGGLAARQLVITTLNDLGYEVVDLGVQSDASVDYPDIVEIAVKRYESEPFAFGVLLCGTGIGVSIAANRHAHIRCALPQNVMAAELSKQHNNANFLAFGARVQYAEGIDLMLRAYDRASFLAGRHTARVEKLS